MAITGAITVAAIVAGYTINEAETQKKEAKKMMKNQEAQMGKLNDQLLDRQKTERESEISKIRRAKALNTSYKPNSKSTAISNPLGVASAPVSGTKTLLGA